MKINHFINEKVCNFGKLRVKEINDLIVHLSIECNVLINCK